MILIPLFFTEFCSLRWLVSYIENHYLELNDRVIHDTLEEKNREKARRAVVREQMDQSQPRITSDRPQSQKSNKSLSCLGKRQSSSELEAKDTVIIIPDEHTSKTHQVSSGLASRGIPANGTESIGHNDGLMNKTNYLIKSRPTSSSGDTFLISRKIANASSARGSRRSLPDIHFSSSRKMPISSTSKQDSLVKYSSQIDSTRNNILPPPSTSPFVVVSGRLSPEGADSDEGISNPAFDYSLEHLELGSKKPSTSATTATCPDNFNSNLTSPTFTPEKFRKLVRSESSDTEVSGNIL
jgi:hypothetical protein